MIFVLELRRDDTKRILLSSARNATEAREDENCHGWQIVRCVSITPLPTEARELLLEAVEERSVVIA